MDPVRPAAPTVSETPPPPPPRPTRQATGGWRDRLPEIAATIGAVLVVAAVAGFVTSSWEELDLLQRAVALAAVAVALTVGGVYVEGASRRALDRVTSLVHLSASCAVAASATLAGYAAAPGAARLAIAAGGAAGALHAGWVLSRERSSPTRTAALTLSLLYAVGPAGTSLRDRFSTMDPMDLGLPVIGAVDPTVAGDAFLVPGLGWAVTGAVLLTLSPRLGPRARRTATVLATGILLGAALMLNVLTNPVGAFAALCIVLAYVVYGHLTDRAGIKTAGAVGVLLAGIRVLWGLFSGQIAVTVAVLVVGLTLLAYALKAARDRAHRESASGIPPRAT